MSFPWNKSAFSEVKKSLFEEIKTKQIKSKKWCGWILKVKSKKCEFQDFYKSIHEERVI